MRITLLHSNNTVIGQLDVPEEIELENFLALAKGEIPALANVPIRQLALFHSGRMLNTYEKSLKDCGLLDGDMAMVTIVPTQASAGNIRSQPTAFGNIDFSSIQIPDNSNRRRPPRQGQGLANAVGMPPVLDAASLRQLLLADPAAQSLLRERNPELAEALNNPEQFEHLYNEQLSSRREAVTRRMQMLNRNPFDPEVQRMIEEEIRQNEIESHMEAAIEHMPETFGIVTMLYIRCLVNGHEVKAFVDSGAQATIMSEQCARRCNITRLIDRRFAGIARGVGTSKILGRIHMAQLQIENDYFPTSFNVLEDAGVDMLFGLDMLKRHQCIIDLQKNVLVIGTTGTSTPFLPESELPEGRHHGPPSPHVQDRQLAEALERSAAEAEAASLSAAVAASNVQRSTSPKPMEQASHGQEKPSSELEQPQIAQSSTSASVVSQEGVDHLVAMGFKREDAIRELEKSRGNVNQAASVLIASSLPAPPPMKKK